MLTYVAIPNDQAREYSVVPEIRHLVRSEVLLRAAWMATFWPTRAYINAPASRHAVYRINEAALQEADNVLAVVPAGVPTYGTPMEIRAAHDAGKPVAVLSDAMMSLQLTGMQGDRLRLFGLRAASAAIDWLLLTQEKRAAGNTLKFVGDPDLAPRRTYGDDAGFDLVCSEDTRIPCDGFRDVPCGINVELPHGMWALITGRSSTLRRRNLLVSNGVIDGGWRGPLFAGVWNLGEAATSVQAGERIAQLIPFHQASLGMRVECVDALSASERGERGFGSTGT